MVIWKNSIKNYKLYKVKDGTYYFVYKYTKTIPKVCKSHFETE